MQSTKRSTVVTIGVLVLIICCAAFFAYSVYMRNYRAAHQPDIALIQPETSVGYKDMSGNAVDLRAYKDKPLIINAWATWSPFSRAELTTLASLKREFGDAFEVIAINRKESPATIAAYLEQIGDISGITFLQDESDQFFGTVSGYAMPESVFYNREGNTVAHVRGTMTEAEMRENIARMLAQRNDE